jgi:hypothetical protein
VQFRLPLQTPLVVRLFLLALVYLNTFTCLTIPQQRVFGRTLRLALAHHLQMPHRFKVLDLPRSLVS